MTAAKPIPADSTAVAPTPVPTSDPTPTAGIDEPLLRRGARGENVRDLQELLRQRGWRIAVDGVYGPHTTAVVRALQKRRGLLIDGVVGPHTRAVLRRET